MKSSALLGLMCLFFRIKNTIEKINKSNEKKGEAKRLRTGKICTENDGKWGKMHTCSNAKMRLSQARVSAGSCLLALRHLKTNKTALSQVSSVIKCKQDK